MVKTSYMMLTFTPGENGHGAGMVEGEVSV